MIRANFFTLLFPSSFLSSSCFADLEAYNKLMDVERVSVFKVGKELSYVLKSGTIIGDCIIRQAKFYSDERYILVLRKTTGNALTNKFNTDHDFTLSTPSWFLEDNKTKSLTNRNSGKALYGMYYSTLNVKIQKSKKMD